MLSASTPNVEDIAKTHNISFINVLPSLIVAQAATKSEKILNFAFKTSSP